MDPKQLNFLRDRFSGDIDVEIAEPLTLQHHRALEQLFGWLRGSGANR
jgi:hypothetical protein